MDTILTLFHDPILVGAARAALAVLLLIGGWEKLRDPVVFRGAMENYGVLPAVLTPIVSLLLPVAEVVCGLSLLYAPTGHVGAVGTLVLLVAMTTVVAVSLMNGRTGIDCGCGGLSSQPLSWALVVRNVVLIGVASVATQQAAGRVPGPLDFFLAAAISLALLGLYASFNQLMSNAPLAAKTSYHPSRMST